MINLLHDSWDYFSGHLSHQSGYVYIYICSISPWVDLKSLRERHFTRHTLLPTWCCRLNRLICQGQTSKTPIVFFAAGFTWIDGSVEKGDSRIWKIYEPGDSIRDLLIPDRWRYTYIAFEFGSRELTIPKRSPSQNCQEHIKKLSSWNILRCIPWIFRNIYCQLSSSFSGSIPWILGLGNWPSTSVLAGTFAWWRHRGGTWSETSCVIMWPIHNHEETLQKCKNDWWKYVKVNQCTGFKTVFHSKSSSCLRLRHRELFLFMKKMSSLLAKSVFRQKGMIW